MFRSHHSWPLLCLIVLSLSIGAGCESFNGDDDDDNDDREVSGRDRISQTISEVPREAERIEEGRGELSWAARADGTIYLYDVNDRRVVDTQRVRKGQRYTIAPERDLATLDGRPVYEQNLDRDHTHRLYFLSDRDR
jgi:hypothetical protein